MRRWQLACQHVHVDPDLNTVTDVLAGTDARLEQGLTVAGRVWPTGFDPLDGFLGGGLRAGELTLLGGPQSLGKTTFALQVARNVAAAGGQVVYFSYEHDAGTLLERLLVIEAGEILGEEGMTLRHVRQALDGTRPESAGLAGRLRNANAGAEAVAAMKQYSDNLYLHRSNGRTTTTDVIGEVVEDLKRAGGQPVVIVDYLQKVPDPHGSDLDQERMGRVAAAFKDLALLAGCPVLAIAAAEREGIAEGKRMRIHHLRGTATLAYEADVVLIMNEKFDVVARHHLVYSTTSAERFREYVVVSLEKNRSGIDRVDLEFRKRFAQGRFDRSGRAVVEQLVDERVVVE